MKWKVVRTELSSDGGGSVVLEPVVQKPDDEVLWRNTIRINTDNELVVRWFAARFGCSVNLRAEFVGNSNEELEALTSAELVQNEIDL